MLLHIPDSSELQLELAKMSRMIQSADMAGSVEAQHWKRLTLAEDADLLARVGDKSLSEGYTPPSDLEKKETHVEVPDPVQAQRNPKAAGAKAAPPAAAPKPPPKRGFGGFR